MFEQQALIGDISESPVKFTGIFWSIFHFIEKIRIPLALLLVVVLFPSVSLEAASPSLVNQAAKSNNVSTISPANIFYIQQINQLRVGLGKSALTYDSALEASAALKAKDMMANDYWSHYSPYGQSFSDFIWRESPDSSKVGENLARCFVTRDSAFEALVASPTHYQIMVDNFTSVGVSEITNVNDGCVYAVFHFAKNNPV